MYKLGQRSKGGEAGGGVPGELVTRHAARRGQSPEGALRLAQLFCAGLSCHPGAC